MSISVRQRFEDILLLLKQDRKFQIITVVVLIFFMWGMFGSNPPRRYGQTQQVVDAGSSGMGEHEAYEDLVRSIGTDINELRLDVQKNREIIQYNQENLQSYEKKTAEIFKKVIERIGDIEAGIQNTSAGVGTEIVDIDGDSLDGIDEPGLEPWGDIKTAEVAPPEELERDRIAIIGAGDSVGVKLLAGVNAPTDGTPYPVVFRLDGNVEGPDGSALPLGEARLIAAAQGSLSDQRALFRLTSLNIRYPNGAKKVLDVDGWIVGEDGIRGMEGILVDPLGKVLLGSLVSGAIQGAGQGFAQGQVRTQFQNGGGVFSQVEGDQLAGFALGRGLGRAGQDWSKIIQERSKQLVPHVKVLSGRNGTAIFSKNIEIPGLFESLEGGEFAFVSLD